MDSVVMRQIGRVGVAGVAGNWRIVAAEPINAGEPILVIDGRASPRPSRHSLQVDEHTHLDLEDGHSGEELPDRYHWRFLNHSCEPNAVMRGRTLVALRAIPVLAEITFNYNTTEHELAAPFTCHCGSPHCSGQIRGFKHLSLPEQERLRPVLAEHLLRRLGNADRGAAMTAEEPLLLHEFFERTARAWPHRPAVETPPGVDRPGRRVVTYAELRRQSASLANRLREFVAGECVVAILLPRNSERLYCAQLAVLQAGAAYACIDPAFPDEQAREILREAEAVALLTDGDGAARAEAAGLGIQRILDVTKPLAPAGEGVLAPPRPPWLTPASLAYVIYTSGTTGRPKGVMIEHRAIANLVRADLEEFRLSPEDRVGQSSSPAYDSALEEVWLAFAAGATVVVMDEATARLGPDLVPWLERERITVWCPPPTLLRATGCAEPQKSLPNLRLLYVGGEALPRDVADAWSPGRRLVNGYGPTECTVTALRGEVRLGQPVTIGRPVPGLRAWILDEALEEVAPGHQGELCLGGVGLARGYRNRPELTSEKFPEHPKWGRIYRTGDLAYRDGEGDFFCHGRVDAQVKLRGYRVELEAIEARLGECPGVRQAACRVQHEDPAPVLVAFVVPTDPRTAPSFTELKAALRAVLPAYMVPSRFRMLACLPTTVGGKLNREALPHLAFQDQEEVRGRVEPRDGLEQRVAAGFSRILGLAQPVSIQTDFFADLGGDSLRAAQLISLLREDALTAVLTVRDLYEARTAAELAQRARARGNQATSADEGGARASGRPWLATVIQALWLAAGLVLWSAPVYWAAFKVLPFLVGRLGLVLFLLLGPLLVLALLAAYTPLALLLAVLAKRCLIGQYQPLRAPVWGSFYVRNWMVQRCVRLVPWRFLEGTTLQLMALRALGARIGRRVHLHRDVRLLQGGWDLLEIGDDVTIGQEVSIRLVDLEDGQLVIAPVKIGEGATLEVRAGLAGNTCLEPETYLTALSSLSPGSRIPRGERWDGIPARPAGRAPGRPPLGERERLLRPVAHGIALLLARLGLGALLALPVEILSIGFAAIYGITADNALAWLVHPVWDHSLFLVGLIVVLLSAPLSLMVGALILRALGPVSAGVLSRWSWGYLRVWVKTGLVKWAGVWLSGTLFWPVWLRWAGMKVGGRCEISTIIDVIPELIAIGPETFLADGIYLGGPRLHRGTVTLASTRLGGNTFLGNHVVIAGGQQLPDSVLLGVCTTADDHSIRTGTAWFGHPPFELPRREVVSCDRRFTHEPSFIRYVNRVVWELLRFTLPVAPLLVLAVWFRILGAAGAHTAWPVFLAVIAPLVNLGAAAALCLLVLGLKWVLLGRVRPGQHPLWSCWCSRWDFLYVVWGAYARGPIAMLEGTLLLPWFLRAMGARVGRQTILGDGFAQVVDPDMLRIEDGATVNCLFQAHTFEDRILKIDRVTIRRGATVGSAAVLFYGAEVGVRTRVAPHSVIMKRERLLDGRSYAGCPTQPMPGEPAGAAGKAFDTK